VSRQGDRYTPPENTTSFNPVLGFLSVSTSPDKLESWIQGEFQSRAGFSECLDKVRVQSTVVDILFQSRAGFSECLDGRPTASSATVTSFQSRAGFSECLDSRYFGLVADEQRFQSRAGFSECLDLVIDHRSHRG